MSVTTIAHPLRFGMRAADGPRKPVILGLTLIELFVGVIIVGIVAAVGIGIYAGSQNNGPQSAAVPAASASVTAAPDPRTGWVKVFQDDYAALNKRCDGSTLVYRSGQRTSDPITAVPNSPECR